MIEVLASRAVASAVLVSASPLAAQDGLPQPASNTVDVELTVEGAAEVPAQGYRIGALLNRRPRSTQAGSRPGDRTGLIRQLEARELPEREACSPSYPLGFIGNELAFPLEDEPDSEEAAETVTTVEDALEMLPQSYSGLFASRAEADEAERQLRPHAGFVQIQPVLFDCTAARENATIAALRNAQSEVETLVRALGMRNAGVTRIENAASDQAMIAFSAMRSAQASGAADTVQVPATLKVTFHLER